MIVPEWIRIICYIGVACLPIWIDWAAKSWDTSARGLTMPILGSLLTGLTVFLARTRAAVPEIQPPQPPDE